MYQLLWSAKAKKDLSKLDKKIAKVLIIKTESILNNTTNPLDHLKPLRYARKGQYKFRVGTYRVICIIHNQELIIEAVEIGHRKEIYNSKRSV